MRCLRGDHSQRDFSKALGFTSNVVYTWETGRRFPEASTFFKAAARFEPRFIQRFLALLRADAKSLERSNPATSRGVQRLVEHLCQGVPMAELSERLGVDRTTLSRWVHGKTEPRLPDLLRLLQATTQQLFAVIALLTDPAQMPSARAAFRDLQLQQRLAYDVPWSHAILRALELDAYAALPEHEPGFLADRIGLSREHEQEYLDQLAEAEQIRWTGTHWVSHRIMTVDTRQEPARNRALKAHWAKVSSERVLDERTSPDALFSFNLFAVSEAAFQTVRQLHLEYFDRVRAVIDEAPGSDRVVLMNVHLVPLQRSNSAKIEPQRRPRR